MKKKIRKEITFFCTDKVERQCCESIIKEAELRGYKTKITENKFEKAEIGFYLSHINFPKNSKFSVVMLHDLGQQHGEWPNMWKNEFWNHFDLGLLPNKEWVNMWSDVSCYDFAKPRYGCYYAGWPKSDRMFEKDYYSNTKKITDMIDITKKTILYAPSWEWDDRELEIAESVKNMNVNLLIKQFPATPSIFPEQYEIINEAHKKVKELNLQNVHILDANTNIYDAICVCDVLVSEESSTLYEAMMFDKPVIAVTDWLIPDTIPARLPEFPYEFAIHISKKDLQKTIDDVVCNNLYKNKIIEYRKENYSNMGNVSKTVMNILCDVLEGKMNNENRIEEKPLIKTPKEFKRSVRNRKKIMIIFSFKKRYVEKNVILSNIWELLKNFKNKIKHN